MCGSKVASVKAALHILREPPHGPKRELQAFCYWQEREDLNVQRVIDVRKASILASFRRATRQACIDKLSGRFKKPGSSRNRLSLAILLVSLETAAFFTMRATGGADAREPRSATSVLQAAM